MSFIRKHHLILFFILWFIVQLIQAGNTELLHDEAYYWVYSRFPAWGYFDHPPMIAMLIKMGYGLFQNELGVRLLVTVMSTLTLIITYLLLPRKNDGLFYAIVCSLAVLQIGGVLAVPDLPLSFFVALFFWCYKKYIEQTTVLNALILGIVMALMLYSKYHGILIIGFVFLSRLSLFTRWQTYLAAATGILLFFPHLYWQYQHGFPSVQFHLFERNSPGYQFKNTLEYLGGQILIAGPLTGWLLLWAAYKYKPADAFEKALRFAMLGFYVFFLITTLKGRVEANWTIPAFVPLIILSHQYLLETEKLRKILIKTAPFMLAIVLIVRLYMMMDLKPVKMISKDEFHRNRIWTGVIEQKAAGLPVVFYNSYQFPSKYWFYTGHPSYSANTTYYRRNNFNFWPIEEAFAGQTVYAVYSYDPIMFKDSIRTPNGLKGGTRIENFYSFSRLRIEREGPIQVINGSCNSDSIRLFEAADLRHLSIPDSLLRQKLQLHVFKKNELISFVDTNTSLKEILSGDKVFRQNYPVNLEKGVYTAAYALPSSVNGFNTINSSRYKLLIK